MLATKASRVARKAHAESLSIRKIDEDEVQQKTVFTGIREKLDGVRSRLRKKQKDDEALGSQLQKAQEKRKRLMSRRSELQAMLKGAMGGRGSASSSNTSKPKPAEHVESTPQEQHPEQRSEQHSEQRPEQHPEQHRDQLLDQRPEQRSEQRPAQRPEQRPEHHGEQLLGQRPEQRPEQRFEQCPEHHHQEHRPPLSPMRKRRDLRLASREAGHTDPEQEERPPLSPMRKRRDFHPHTSSEAGHTDPERPVYKDPTNMVIDIGKGRDALMEAAKSQSLSSISTSRSISKEVLKSHSLSSVPAASRSISNRTASTRSISTGTTSLSTNTSSTKHAYSDRHNDHHLPPRTPLHQPDLSTISSPVVTRASMSSLLVSPQRHAYSDYSHNDNRLTRTPLNQADLLTISSPVQTRFSVPSLASPNKEGGRQVMSPRRTKKLSRRIQKLVEEFAMEESLKRGKRVHPWDLFTVDAVVKIASDVPLTLSELRIVGVLDPAGMEKYGRRIVDVVYRFVEEKCLGNQLGESTDTFVSLEEIDDEPMRWEPQQSSSNLMAFL